MIDLTIIIPTHNRKKLVLRNLKYLSNFNIKVIVSESGITKNYINFPKNNFTFLSCIDMPMHKKIFKSLDYVDTKYVTICADDDFISMENLQFFINFLENNNSYSIVDGTYVYFKKYFGLIKINQAYGNKYDYDNFFDNPNLRIDYAIRNYSNFMYSVIRKEHLKICMQFINEFIDDKNFPEVSEISINLISSVLGKQRSLKKMWMAKDLNRYSIYKKTKQFHNRESNEAKVISDWEEFFSSKVGLDYKNLIIKNFLLDGNKFDLSNLSIIKKKKYKNKFFFNIIKKLNSILNNNLLLSYKKFRIFYFLFKKKDYKKIGYPWSSYEEQNDFKLILDAINDK